MQRNMYQLAIDVMLIRVYIYASGTIKVAIMNHDSGSYNRDRPETL